MPGNCASSIPLVAAHANAVRRRRPISRPCWPKRVWARSESLRINQPHPLRAPGPAAGLAAGWVTVRWPLPMAGVRAAVTPRSGGASTGGWAAVDGSGGLNLGIACGDDPDAVAVNRGRVAEALDRSVLWLSQVHGVDVVDGDRAGTDGPPPRADAAFTTRADIALAVLIADCLPVLVTSTDGAIVGAAHAGWRGLAGGVVTALVDAMRARRPQARLQAWLGPRIGAGIFEVGPEVREAFRRRLPDAEAAFVPSQRADHWLCDLGALARRELAAAGIVAVADPGFCTHREPRLFWSHRRDRPGGRMCASICRTA